MQNEPEVPAALGVERSGRWARGVAFVRRTYPAWIVWVVIPVFIAIVVWRVGAAGMSLREGDWTSTRTIHYHGDIGNGFSWGGVVNDVARQANNGQEPTFWQLVRAEDIVYQQLGENESDSGQRLDYPPGRLLVMALWHRWVDRSYPDLNGWVGRRGTLGVRGNHAMGEDLAEPLLMFNTINEAAAAVLGAALVALWIGRSARFNSPTPSNPLSKKLAAKKSANGLLAFMVAAPSLFYGIYVALMPVASPPPAVTISAPPTIQDGGDGCTATVFASVNPQGRESFVHAEWGQRAGCYTQRSDQQTVAAENSSDITIAMTQLPPKTLIHYRIVASNESKNSRVESARGQTNTDDATLMTDNLTQPPQPSAVFGAVWLSIEQWIGIAILFVAMCWSMRCMDESHRMWAAALLAGVFIWLNPAMLVDGHSWPQWDCWLLPPFLLAALLASLNCWLTAGLVVGAGIMFKGQFLIGAPVLIVWPIAAGRIGAAIRMVVGFVLMTGIWLSPWIVLDARPPAEAAHPIEWIIAVMIAAAIGIAMSIYLSPYLKWDTFRSIDLKRFWRGVFRSTREGVEEASPPAEETVPFQQTAIQMARYALILLGVIAPVLLVLLSWPADADIGRSTEWLLILALLIIPWLLPRRSKKSLGVWMAAVLAAAIWLSPWLFHGDWSWKTVGFEYGAQKFDDLSIPEAAIANMGAILERRFNWGLHDPAISLRLPNIASLFFTGDQPGRIPQWIHQFGLDGTILTLDLKQSMVGLYALMLIACGIGAAMHARRRSPRILAALAAPWAMMPNVLPQMGGRYFLWGGVFATMLVAIEAELLIIPALISLLCAEMNWGELLSRGDHSRSPQLADLALHLSPDLGWVLLSSALIILYLAVVPVRSTIRVEGSARLNK
jgi:hypothetical protein